MKILVLDNYDSFTYNLVHLIHELGYGSNTSVHRNDKISLEAVAAYDKILLSPGPSLPKDAGIMLDLIEKYAPHKSILGICLGHQGISEVFGAELFNLKEVLHGIEGKVQIQSKEEVLFQGLPMEFNVCHYHSWAVKKDSIKSPLEITAVDSEGMVMGIRHTEYDVRGLQFHPESILTEHGKEILQNWFNH
ncbi:aminodeoxychorismate/anthranilate synthase component II [Rapidithrix thailandica]|uniref:Aminodeoxychorismate/anthranilate synthase component II n=1 Tax=Rapidithrix thailandica TaxID=413964 RepID=A0AAW9S876_9BACT